MKYCTACGNDVRWDIPDNDNRERHICNHCGQIHYQNPRIIAGSVPVHGDQILLCRRAIEPRRGFWTLPAGFMENGETVQQAAERETLEEANARVRVESLYTLFNLTHINQIYMFFRAELAVPEFSAGPESLEVALFSEAEIPWDELAFAVVERTLRLHFEDRLQGNYPFRIEDIHRSDPRFSKRPRTP
ncbi:MAG: NUDIX hydrolase [Pseudomonadota bacterium]|nr:NUDIX hydrolase [Pseudomonadota bacterium]